MARATKAERRARRKPSKRIKLDGGWQAEFLETDWPVGPHVESPSKKAVLRAIEQITPDLDWKTVGPRVVPLFERVRPYPPELGPRAQAIVAPGVTIGFGVDVGPAFVTVSPEMVEGWSMSVADLAAHSLGNLHAMAAKLRPSEIQRAPIDDVEVEALQTNNGVASVLVLAPTELGRIFGRQPGLFIAPMRNLLLRFPADVEPSFAAWVYAEIASEDPNCLGPRAFAFDGRDVIVESLGASVHAA